MQSLNKIWKEEQVNESVKQKINQKDVNLENINVKREYKMHLPI